jgi:hypothetical protein
MEKEIQFQSIPLSFDHSAIENPYYETSSRGDSLVEIMKNNELVLDN